MLVDNPINSFFAEIFDDILSAIIACPNKTTFRDGYTVYQHIHPGIIIRVVVRRRGKPFRLLVFGPALFLTGQEAHTRVMTGNPVQVIELAWAFPFGFLVKRNGEFFVVRPDCCTVLMDTCYSQNVTSSVPHDANMNLETL